MKVTSQEPGRNRICLPTSEGVETIHVLAGSFLQGWGLQQVGLGGRGGPSRVLATKVGQLLRVRGELSI